MQTKRVKKKRKAATEIKKKAKAKNKEMTTQQSSSSSSEDGEESDDKPAKAKQATHIGRYHKRENAKRVTSYSATDLAAILGASSSGPPAASQAPEEDNEWPQFREVRAVQRPEDSDVSSSGHVSEGSDGERDTKKNSSKAAVTNQSMGPKSWWTGLFVKAGRMGSTKHELHSRKLQSEGLKPLGFSEKDQEDLAMQASDAVMCIFSMG